MFLLHLFEALRPSQWIKNASVFAAALLTGHLTDQNTLINSFYAFFVFCFLSSSSYLVNDVIDFNKDKLHPLKKLRPIPAGKVSKTQALATALLLVILGLVLASRLNPTFLSICLVFVVLQYLYSLVFKRKAVLDILGIAVFFIIRTYAGEVATGFRMPVWITITVIFFSLFIASGKRRSELVGTGTTTRSSLANYGMQLLDFYINMFGVATLLSYALFTYEASKSNPIVFDGVFTNLISKELPNWANRKWYMVTLLPVIVGIMRYGQIIYELGEGERPEKVVSSDIPLILAIFIWGITMVSIIYVF